MKKPDYKLLFWIETLCFIGSFINTMGFIKYSTPMSNVTGSFLRGAESIVSGKIFTFISVLSVPLLFFLGTIVSGVFFSKKIKNKVEKYGEYLILLGLLLLVSTILFHSKNYFLYFLALVTGMQNGMYLNYKGKQCKTTHLTGVFTDFGTALGKIIGGNKQERYKIHFYSGVILSAIIGMIVGGEVYLYFGDNGFYFPALIYIIIGVACIKKKIILISDK